MFEQLDTLKMECNPDTLNLADTLQMQSIPPLSSEYVNSFIDSAGTTAFYLAPKGEYWIYFTLFTLIVAIVFARFYLGNLLLNSLNAAIRYNVSLSLYKDNSQIQRQKNHALDGIYFVSMALFAYSLEHWSAFFPFGLSGSSLFLFNLILLGLLFYLKKFMLNLIGILFECRNLFKEYLYHSFGYNKLMGLIFTPLNLFLLFSDGLFNDIIIGISIITLMVLIIMKIVRGIMFTLKNRVLNFYMFLYLCALEIVPFLLLYKWLISIV